MKPSRINVIGASGVGKTTLGRALADELGIAHFDADDYYHFPTDPPFRKQRSPEERCSLLERDLAGLDAWVLSGGAGTWEPKPALDYTLHVFLRLPSELRLGRLALRERDRYGPRILTGGDMEADHVAFMEWTRGYDDSSSEGTNTLAAHEAVMRKATCPVLRLSGPMTLQEALRTILAEMGRG